MTFQNNVKSFCLFFDILQESGRDLRSKDNIE